MKKIYGYGEDGLTLWLLTQKLDLFLQHEKIKDESPKKDFIILYRPSMGRGACYGEFDAILSTSKCVYLFESKWIHTNGSIKLKSAQVKRHEIFNWYFQNLKENNISDTMWNEFRKEFQDDFRKISDGKDIPEAKTKLSNNIRYIIGKVKKGKQEVKNILLLFNDREDIQIKEYPKEFVLVDIDLIDLNDKGWKKLYFSQKGS